MEALLTNPSFWSGTSAGLASYPGEAGGGQSGGFGRVLIEEALPYSLNRGDN